MAVASQCSSRCYVKHKIILYHYNMLLTTDSSCSSFYGSCVMINSFLLPLQVQQYEYLFGVGFWKSRWSRRQHGVSFFPFQEVVSFDPSHWRLRGDCYARSLRTPAVSSAEHNSKFRRQVSICETVQTAPSSQKKTREVDNKDSPNSFIAIDKSSQGTVVSFGRRCSTSSMIVALSYKQHI